MEVEITVLDACHADYASRLRAVLTHAARHRGVTHAHMEAYIVGNDFMEKNVLAYPSVHDFPRPDLAGRRDLGELYINPHYITEHGEDFVCMAIHGFLHLLGYDHRGKHDTVKMDAAEKELRAAVIPQLSHE